METDRLMQLLALKVEYDRMGLRSVEDYLAAGFTEDELAAAGIFDTPSYGPDNVGERGVLEELGRRGNEEAQSYEPPARDRHAYAIADKLAEITGMSGREAYKYARDIMGSTDPNTPLYDSMGLVDMTPLGAGYDTTEGASTAAEGVQNMDLRQFGRGIAQTALGVASVIPAERAIAKGAATVLDPVFRKQAAAFEARNAPAFPASGFEGGRYYVPSINETADINQALANGVPLSPTHQGYVDARLLADDLAAQGVPDREIAEKTGILRIPMVDKQGNRVGTRPVAVMNDAEFADLRPVQHKGWTVEYVGDLPKKVAGEAIPGTKTVRLNKNLSADVQGQIKNHEFTHVDFHDSGIDQVGAGSDTANFADRSGLPRDMTRAEMYTANPGEMVARLAEGVEPTMARRLTAAEVLNPYINKNFSYPERIAQAARTTMFSETRPPIFGPAFAFPYDRHVGVPMDLAKAQMYDFTVPKHRLGFSSVDDMLDFYNMERKITRP